MKRLQLLFNVNKYDNASAQNSHNLSAQRKKSGSFLKNVSALSYESICELDQCRLAAAFLD